MTKKQLFTTHQMNMCVRLVSDDYGTVIMEVVRYMSETRVHCPHCRRKFKTEASLENMSKGSTETAIFHDILGEDVLLNRHVSFRSRQI